MLTIKASRIRSACNLVVGGGAVEPIVQGFADVGLDWELKAYPLSRLLERFHEATDLDRGVAGVAVVRVLVENIVCRWWRGSVVEVVVRARGVIEYCDGGGVVVRLWFRVTP